MRGSVGACLFVCLIVTVSLALADRSIAGSFETPIELTACGIIHIAEEAMTDPSTAFIGAPSTAECEKLCAKATKVCRGAVKDVAACINRIGGNHGTFGKLNCDAEYPDDAAGRKACKADVRAYVSTWVEGTKLVVEDNLGDCDAWGAVCADACSPL
jgi:hypothetical protein